jgi:hypothetical protein
MNTYKNLKGLLLIFLISILSACGGGGGSGDSLTPPVIIEPPVTNNATVLSGQVADGYLVDARIFLDRNGNRRLDAGEPWTLSKAQGIFLLEVPTGEGELYPVVAEIIAGQTIDEDQPAQTVIQSYILEAPVGRWSFISPLTSLIKAELDKNPSLSFSAAEGRVRSQLSLSSSISLSEDYVRSQEQPELDQAHRTAKIVAGLMGNLQTEIERNVGAEHIDSYRIAISYLISDQVLTNGAQISLALPGAIDADAVQEITQAILTGIDLESFDSELLERYVERIEQSNPVWDMTPPKIVSKNPASAGETSIDAALIITFDEALDAASVGANTLMLSGPTGPVKGILSYNPALKQISFVPDGFLLAFTSYQVELDSITDIYGNPLNSPAAWSFSTLFDQLPPELPEF